MMESKENKDENKKWGPWGWRAVEMHHQRPVPLWIVGWDKAELEADLKAKGQNVDFISALMGFFFF